MRGRISAMLAILIMGMALTIGLGPQLSTAQDLDAAKARPPDRAQSYINPDTGLATENPSVNPDSECRSPDQRDGQQVSPMGMTTNNVHNDACLVRNGNPFDGKATFEIDGRGTFSACPDPDGAGPKTSMVKRDGKRCLLDGYQETGMAGDEEYHARINHTGQAGETMVTFCHDPNQNGCADAKVKDVIRINWQQ